MLYVILILINKCRGASINEFEVKSQISADEYQSNLLVMFAILREGNKKVIWVKTTPVYDDIRNRRCINFQRYNKDVLLYNQILDAIMLQNGI